MIRQQIAKVSPTGENLTQWKQKYPVTTGNYA
jgi:hypothetical protein